MEINPQELKGIWNEGWALDLHTLKSIPKEWTTKKVKVHAFVDGKSVEVEKEVQDKVTKWDTTYTPIGLEMNHLKYWNERQRVDAIAETAAEFLKQKIAEWKISLIIPVPPSDTTREFQPVYEIVEHIGRIREIEIDFNILRKLKSTTQLKEIEDPAMRKEVLNGAFSIQGKSLTEKNVLILDDLYRSGETLNSVCDVIINEGKAKSVYVLTITKTRSKR
jgi:competence protein ComFC